VSFTVLKYQSKHVNSVASSHNSLEMCVDISIDALVSYEKRISTLLGLLHKVL